MGNTPEQPPAEPTSISVGVDDTVGESEPYGGRFKLGDRGLREHTARGVLVNSAFQVGFITLGLLRNVAVAAFLTASEFGLWGLVVGTLMTLVWLKQLGIGSKYLQQDEPDQVAAFQKAFTLELAFTCCFLVLAAAVLPLYAVIYGRAEILAPSMVLLVALLLHSLQAPVWVFYRQMRFVRQRVLESVDPVVSTAVMLGLAIAGAGYWSLVIGILAGSFAGAIVVLTVSPFPIRLRYDGSTLREYFSFSWPLLVSGAGGMVAVQGAIIIGNYTVGLAGIGAIGLAGQVAKFADQVDAIVSRTIYPAVCAVKDRVDLLQEAFVKSNRLALMWGLPFGVGLAFFGPDLVTYVLGETWRQAEPLLQAFGIIIGLRQIGFNWMLFFSATGNTRPIAVEGAAIAAAFLLVTAPLMLVIGMTGFVIGSAATVGAQILVRGYFLSRLFENFGLARHLVRACLPSLVAAGVLLSSRAAVSIDRSLGLTLAELALYAVTTALATWAFERRLLAEVAGYVRRTRRVVPAAEPEPPGAVAA